MRRVLVGAAVVVAASLATTHTTVFAATPRPTMAATTIASSRGSHAIVVTLNRAGSIGLSPQDLQIRTDAAWAAVFLVQRAQNPVTVGLVVSRPPQGCGATHCVHAEGFRSFSTTAAPDRGGTPQPRFRLPPGQYVLYALAPSGRNMRATIRLAGPSGTTAMRPNRPVKSEQRAVRVTGTGTASARGSWPLRVKSPSLLALSMWRSTLPGQRTPTAASGKACLERGNGSEPRSVSCLLGTSRDQVGGIGANDVDSGGFRVGSWLNTRQTPGDYTLFYDLHVAGQDPAVGAFALWVSLV